MAPKGVVPNAHGMRTCAKFGFFQPVDLLNLSMARGAVLAFDVFSIGSV
jgi:hypothetical protein